MKNLFNTITATNYHTFNATRFVFRETPKAPETVSQQEKVREIADSQEKLRVLDKETVYKKLDTAIKSVESRKEDEKGVDVSDGVLLYNDGKSFAVEKDGNTVVYYFEQKSGSTHIFRAKNPQGPEDLQRLSDAELTKVSLLLEEYRLKDCLESGKCLAGKTVEVTKEIKKDHILKIDKEVTPPSSRTSYIQTRLPRGGLTVEKWTEKCVYELPISTTRVTPTKGILRELFGSSVEVETVNGRDKVYLRVKINPKDKVLYKRFMKWTKEFRLEGFREITPNSTLSRIAKNLKFKLKQGTRIVYPDKALWYEKTGKVGKFRCEGVGCSGKFAKTNADLILPGMKVTKIDENTLAVTKPGVKTINVPTTTVVPGKTEYFFTDKDGKRLDKNSPIVDKFIEGYNKKNKDKPIIKPSFEYEWKEFEKKHGKELKYETITYKKKSEKIDVNSIDIEAVERIRKVDGIRTGAEKNNHLDSTEKDAEAALDKYRADMQAFVKEIRKATRAKNESLGALSLKDGLPGIISGIINLFLKDKIGGMNREEKARVEREMPNYINEFIKTQSGLAKALQAGKPIFEVLDRYVMPIASLCAGVLHVADIKLFREAMAYKSKNLESRGTAIDSVNMYEEALKSNMKNRQHLGGIYYEDDLEARIEGCETIQKTRTEKINDAYTELVDDLKGTEGKMETAKEQGQEIEKLIGKDVMAKLGLAIGESGVIYAKEAEKMRKIVFSWLFDGRNSKQGKLMKAKIKDLSKPIDQKQVPTSKQRIEENERRLGELKDIIEIARLEAADDMLDRHVKKLMTPEEQSDFLKDIMSEGVSNTDIIRKLSSKLADWPAENLEAIGFSKQKVESIRDAIKNKKYTPEAIANAKEMMRAVFRGRYQRIDSVALRGRHAMLHGFDESVRHTDDMIQNQRDLLAARYAIDGYQPDSPKNKELSLQHSAAFAFLESYVKDTKYTKAQATVIAKQLIEDFGYECADIKYLEGYFSAGDSLERTAYLKDNLDNLGQLLRTVKEKSDQDLETDIIKNIKNVKNVELRECLLACLEHTPKSEYSSEWFLSVRKGSLPIMIPLGLFKKMPDTVKNQYKPTEYVEKGRAKIPGVEHIPAAEWELLPALEKAKHEVSSWELITNTIPGATVFNAKIATLQAGLVAAHLGVNALENNNVPSGGAEKSKNTSEQTAENVDIISDRKAKRIEKRLIRKLDKGRIDYYLVNVERKDVAALYNYYKAKGMMTHERLEGVMTKYQGVLNFKKAELDNIKKTEQTKKDTAKDTEKVEPTNKNEKEVVEPKLTVEAVKKLSVDQALQKLARGAVINVTGLRVDDYNNTQARSVEIYENILKAREYKAVKVLDARLNANNKISAITIELESTKKDDQKKKETEEGGKEHIKKPISESEFKAIWKSLEGLDIVKKFTKQPEIAQKLYDYAKQNIGKDDDVWWTISMAYKRSRANQEKVK